MGEVDSRTSLTSETSTLRVLGPLCRRSGARGLGALRGGFGPGRKDPRRRPGDVNMGGTAEHSRRWGRQRVRGKVGARIGQSRALWREAKSESSRSARLSCSYLTPRWSSTRRGPSLSLQLPSRMPDSTPAPSLFQSGRRPTTARSRGRQSLRARSTNRSPTSPCIATPTLLSSALPPASTHRPRDRPSRSCGRRHDARSDLLTSTSPQFRPKGTEMVGVHLWSINVGRSGRSAWRSSGSRRCRGHQAGEGDVEGG